MHCKRSESDSNTTGIRYVLKIHQLGVVRAGLLGKVGVNALCLLDYAFRWFFSDDADRILVDGKDYVWLHGPTAINQLPLIFYPKSAVKTQRNYLSVLLGELRNTCLIETTKQGRRLYFRPSELGLTLRVVKAPSAVQKTQDTAPVTLVNRDDVLRSNVPVCKDDSGTTIPAGQDITIPALRDNSTPANIYEPEIKDSSINKLTKGVDMSGNLDRCLSPEEQIFNAYPRHDAKCRGIAAIRQALKTHTFEYLMERTTLYARLYDGDPQFIPHATTFFGEERFKEDPSTWKRNSTASGQPQPRIIKNEDFSTGISEL